MRAFVVLVVSLGMLGFSAPTRAIEFRSVADEITILYDAPSRESAKRLVLTRGYPVEVIIASGQWLRVRDDQGSFAWVESARLSSRRTVMVIGAVAEARKSPDPSATVVFRAEQGVVLDFVGVSGGWAMVRHRGGSVAYVRLSGLWGV